MLAALKAKMILWGGIALAVLSALAVVFFKGRASGKATMRVKVEQAKQNAANAKTAKTVYKKAKQAADDVPPAKPVDVEKRDDFDDPSL